MPISVTLTDAPVDVTVSADAGAVNVSAATVTAVQVAIGDTLSLKTSQVQTGGQPGTLAALNTLVDSINETGGWGDARANVIECADRSHTHAATAITSGTLDAARLPSTVVNTNAQGEIIRTVTVPAGDDASDYFLISLSKGTGAGATYFYVVADGTAFLSGSMTIQGGLVVNGTTTVSLGASSITSGTIATARLASGTASASTFLRGDQAWAAINVATVSGLQTALDTKAAYAQVSTYAAMIALGTPAVLTTVRVTADENKNAANTVYQLWPNGSRLWIAAIAD